MKNQTVHYAQSQFYSRIRDDGKRVVMGQVLCQGEHPVQLPKGHDETWHEEDVTCSMCLEKLIEEHIKAASVCSHKLKTVPKTENKGFRMSARSLRKIAIANWNKMPVDHEILKRIEAGV